MKNYTSVQEVVKNSPELANEATLDGLADLIEKLAPLLQGRRLHNIVDLLAATSDVVEMADEEMVNKLMALYENAVGTAWSLGNTLRHASLLAGQEDEPPSLWQTLRRFSKDEDARRGLNVVVNVLTLLGKQASDAAQPMPED
ncbi:DUF1641 domain-containing protein [Parahaliea sp. F7430]|uniref:DUF1641 domain-containing protein n=2 Tax=Sediminihaliea albiluteola TaxID=2758564 RepID=A0A7W2TTW3_9GAMM|nr:DUF1641 domain-containing protein [Sediminihaliea albiluteola]